MKIKKRLIKKLLKQQKYEAASIVMSGIETIFNLIPF